MTLDTTTRGTTTTIGGLLVPQVEAVPRLVRYDRGRNLYRGYHQHVFRNDYVTDPSRPYLTVNLCGALTRLLSTRTFGDPVDVSVDGVDDAWVDSLLSRSRWDEINMTACRGASYRGDACYKVTWDPVAMDSVITLVNPAHCVVETNPLRDSEITQVEIKQVIPHGDARAVLIETHVAGSIHYDLVEYSEDRLGQIHHGDPLDLGSNPLTAGLQPDVETGLSRIPIVWVANDRDDESGVYGISDYDDVEDIQGELNVRFTRRAEILDKHSDPLIVGPPELQDEVGDVELGGNSKYIPLGQGERAQEVVTYVTWDGQLSAVEKEIDDLIRMFASVAMVDSQALLDVANGSVPASGRAIRLSQMRTQSRVKGKQTTFDRALREVISISTEMASVHGSTIGRIAAVPADSVVLDWSDGLPSDRIDDITEQQAMIDAGVQTRVRAAEVLHGVTEDEARAIVAEVDSESASRQPTLGVTPTFDLGLPMTGDDER